MTQAVVMPNMMTREQVEALLVMRIVARQDNCNSYHGNHVDGQIRALVAVLTGQTPPKFDTVYEIFDLVGIPYDRDENGWSLPDEWLKQRGFGVPHDDYIHPDIKGW